MARPIRPFAVVSTLLSLLFLAPVLAQGNYPERPIRLIVAFPPGGATDTFVRPILEDMQGALGQTIYIDNRAGAGGQVGWHAAATAEPDGYTALMATNALVISVPLYPELSHKFDPRKQYDSVAGLGYSQVAFAVHSAVPATNFWDFVKWARAQKNPVAYASAGAGTVTHLVYEVVREAAKFDALHIPYKGGGPAVADVLAGHVPTIVSSMAVAKTQSETGKLRPLAVTGPARSPALPNVPTLAELGLKHADVDLSFWWGVVVPRGVPEPVRAKLEKAFHDAATKPAARERMAKFDITLDFLPGKVLDAKIANEIVNWTSFVEARGLRK